MKKKRSKRSKSGAGSVYPEGDYWVAAISVGSRTNRRRRKVKVDSEAAAWEQLAKLKAERPGLAVLSEPAVTVRTYLSAWLECVVRPAVRATTFETYESVVRTHVYPGIGSLRLDRVRTEHLRNLFADLERAGVGGRLREVAWLRLKSAFVFAVGRAIAISPMETIPRPRAKRRSMTVWNADEARAFLASTEQSDLAALYRLALSIGLRRGEMLGLQWSDVDLKAGRIGIRHTLTDEGELVEPKTSGSRRPIDLPRRAIEALRHQRDVLLATGLRASPWVFPVVAIGDPRRGEARLSRAVSSAFNAAAKKTTVAEPDGAIRALPRIRFHDLRHTCATLRLANGDHVKVVSEMLGHASVAITLDIYSHVLPSMQRESAERFDAVL
jgi:integrase